MQWLLIRVKSLLSFLCPPYEKQQEKQPTTFQVLTLGEIKLLTVCAPATGPVPMHCDGKIAENAPKVAKKCTNSSRTLKKVQDI